MFAKPKEKEEEQDNKDNKKYDVIIERLDKIIEDNVKINSNNKYFIPIKTVKKIIGEEFLGISDESNLMEKKQ